MRRAWNKEELTNQIVGEINSPPGKQQPRAAKAVGACWKLKDAGNWTRMVGGGSAMKGHIDHNNEWAFVLQNMHK